MIEDVAPGIQRLTLPMSFPPHEVNAWLLADGDGWVVVDTGPGGAECRDIWNKLAAERRLNRVVVTHHHPDHLGNAGLLRLPVAMTDAEWQRAQAMHRRSDAEAGEALARFFTAHGLEPEWADKLRARGNSYRRVIPELPTAVAILAPGDDLVIGGRTWRVLTDAGHTPAHMSLHCAADNLLLSGDQILPRIAAAITVWPGDPDGDPLSSYFAALKRYRALPAETRILPGHGKAFTGLHERLDGLEAHFAALLAGVAARLPCSAAEAMDVVLRRPRDPGSVMFGMGAAIACLNHLKFHNAETYSANLDSGRAAG